MSRLFVLLFMLFLCDSIKPQGFFCDRVGAQLEYVRTNSQDGSLKWRHLLTVENVESSNGARQVTASSAFYKAGGKRLYKANVTENMLIDGEYNVHSHLGELMASYIKARTGLNAKYGGSYTVLPSAIEPGDTLESVSASVKVGPLEYSLEVWGRKVLRYETLSVPAGSFDCIVVEEFKRESGPGHNREVTNLTWYCKGVGYVRHDSFEQDGTHTCEILYYLR